MQGVDVGENLMKLRMSGIFGGNFSELRIFFVEFEIH